MRTPPLFSLLAALTASGLVVAVVVFLVLPGFEGLQAYLEDLEALL